MRDYVAAYREGLTPGPDLGKAVKKYKSNHKIYDNEDELTWFYAYTAYTHIYMVRMYVFIIHLPSFVL